MPIYTFYNSETEEEWDDMMPNDEREEYLKDNPHISQIPAGFAITGDHIMGVGPKVDGGFNDNMQRIAAAHPGSPMADRYGSSTTKATKTREILKKHGAI